jgi:hypothetical protein
MAASVLNSLIAVQVSIQVVRAFVRPRELLATHKDLARKLEDIEKKYDHRFRGVLNRFGGSHLGSGCKLPEDSEFS